MNNNMIALKHHNLGIPKLYILDYTNIKKITFFGLTCNFFLVGDNYGFKY